MIERGPKNPDKRLDPTTWLPDDLQQKAVDEIAAKQGTANFGGVSPEDLFASACKKAYQMLRGREVLTKERLKTIANLFTVCRIEDDTADELVQTILLSDPNPKKSEGEPKKH